MPAHSKTAKPSAQIAVIGIDIGKSVFHLIGLDQRGAIVMKAKLSRGQLETRLANLPPCLIEPAKVTAAIGEANVFRVIFFILTFFSIGLLSNFKKVL